jgi:ribose transport system substrate-binding protein
MSYKFLRAVIALAIVGGLSAGLGACGSSSSSSGKIHLALVTGDNHDPFYVTMKTGAQAEAKKLGVSVTWQGPATFEAQPQITVLDSVLPTHPSALLVAPTDVTALVPAIRQFNGQHIPVVTVDTDVNDHSVRLGNFTSNNVLGGTLAAKFLNTQLGGSGKVAYVGETRGTSTTDQRQAGFEAGLKTTGLTYVGPQFGADDPTVAASTTGALLRRYPDLRGIFASDTAWGDGAATAIRDAHMTGKVKLIAFDAEPDEVQALKAGNIQALIVQKAYDIGVDAVKATVAYVEHKTPVPKQTLFDYVIATPSNINSPQVTKYVYRQK